MTKYCLLCLCLFLPSAVAAETAVTFTSPLQQATLLELYTSEGCSSCPPADRWLSTLKDHPQLWKTIIPIAFHVDYWDYLGWKDPYSNAEYSQRQRNYARFHHIKTVYTPGFIQNGKEWRAWFRSRNLNAILGDTVGRLVVSISDDTVTAQFQPEKAIAGTLHLNAAWLGFDLETEVRDGENEGKNLKHDFVSLGTQLTTGIKVGNEYHWRFTIKPPTKKVSNKKGMAFWVTNGNDPMPIQATGGWM